MTNSTFESLESVRDVDTVRNVRELIEDGVIENYEAIRPVVEYRSRDNARTPMQWDDTAHAGFTDAEPWIPANDDYPEINVARQEGSASVLSYYRDLIALRRRTAALVRGSYDLFHPDDEQLYVYTRTLEGREVVVAINFSDGDRRARLDPLRAEASRLLSNYDDVADAPDGAVEFRPYEARVYRQSQ